MANRITPLAVLGTLVLETEQTFQDCGETANRDYYTTVAPGTYVVELVRYDHRYVRVRCVLPGSTRYVGPQGSRTYAGEHVWSPRAYELAGMLAEGGALPAVGGPRPGIRFEPGPGVEAKPHTFDGYDGPRTMHFLTVCGEDVRTN